MSRKCLLLILVVSCLAITAAAQAATYTIDFANPGFDSGSLLPGWTNDNAAVVGVTGGVSPHSDGYMAELFNPDTMQLESGPGWVRQPLMVGGQPVMVTSESDILSLSIWIKKGSVTGGKVQIYLEAWYNAEFGLAWNDIGSKSSSWSPSATTWTNKTWTPYVGLDYYNYPLAVRIVNANGANPGTQPSFIDDISGTFTGTIADIPEPGTLALLASGLLGLLCYAWRKVR